MNHPNTQPIRLLVVEDTPVNQEVARHLLEKLNCQVRIADDGLQAVEMYQQGFDLIFMDCHMPRMDGYAATTEIRRQQQQTTTGESIPIIALTANATADNRKKCLSIGMNDYITKPFRIEDLHSMLRKWLPAEQGQQLLSVAQALGHSDYGEGPSDDLSHNELINLSVLADLFENLQAKGVNRLVNLYIDTLPNYLREIDEALAGQDGHELKMSAHKLKGASQALGMQKIVNCCKTLEVLADANQFENAAIELENLQKITRQSSQALRNEQKQLIDHEDAVEA